MSPHLPNGIAASSAALPGISGSTFDRPEQLRGVGEDRDRKQRAETHSEDRGHAVGEQVLGAPFLLDPAGRVEIDLVGKHHGADDRDGEIAEGQQLLGAEAVRDLRDEAAGDLVPRRMDRDQRGGEDEHEQAKQAVDALDPLERQHPDRHNQHHRHGTAISMYGAPVR